MTRLDFWFRVSLLWGRIVWRLQLRAARVRFIYRQLAARITGQPVARIRIAYDIVTPESSQYGDVDSRGWIDEIGEACEPDAYDIAEGLTRVDLAVELLTNRGSLEPSASQYHSGIWYSEYGANQGTRDYYEKGEEETRTYHLTGFSEREQSAIYERVTAS